MNPAFDHAYAFTFSPEIEGARSNRASDRGGYTNRGITQGLYDAWRVMHGLPSQTVDLITDDEHRALVLEEFWTPCKCDQLPGPIAAAVFDMAVNSGPLNAKRALQESLHVKVDGLIGDVTLAAANAAGADAVLDFLCARSALIRDDIEGHPADVDSLHGWIVRLLKFQACAAKGMFG
jgi:lysozyme family protein